MYEKLNRFVVGQAILKERIKIMFSACVNYVFTRLISSAIRLKLTNCYNAILINWYNITQKSTCPHEDSIPALSMFGSVSAS